MNNNGHIDLAANHLVDLHKSGLSDEQIAACGFRTLRQPSEVANVLKWKSATKLGPCLLLPYLRPDGSLIPVNEFARIKPDTPRTSKPKDDKPGKPIKYESPIGSKSRLYFPPVTYESLRDVFVPLLVTEGEKKTAKADQEGFVCIGLGGVDAWSKKRATGPDGKKIGKRELISDFDAVELTGREVFIVFDSDLTEKPSVQWAEWNLSQALAERGAIVKVVRLPNGPPDANGEPTKIGLDDFLVAHSADEFRELLNAALPPQKPKRQHDKPNEAPGDPHRLARLFLEQRGTSPAGELVLRFWFDEWWLWSGTAYRVVPATELRADLAAIVKQEFDRLNLQELQQPREDDEKPPTVRMVTIGLLANTMTALSSMCILPSTITQPSWLTEEELFSAAEVIATQTALIHIPSLVAAKPSTLQPTPQFFSAGCVDYGFDAEAECPTWQAFLKSLWPDDPQTIESLQDWFGYLSLPDVRQHKILILVGPPRSGKGVIGRTLKGVIGERSLASPTLSSLAGPFGLWPLNGKTVALIPEARLGRNADAVSVVERLLSISGEDPQDIHRKNLPTITGVKLATRFILMTNELPNLRDSSGAFSNRIILLRTTQSWLGKEDKQLDARLQRELPGILNWAIEGWQRLQERGHFRQPDTGRELLAELADLTSPVSQFIRERCAVGPEFSCDIDDLFASWRNWCEEHGREHAGTQQTFGRDLRSKLPGLAVTQPRTDSGGRIRSYNGIGLRSGTPWHAIQTYARDAQESDVTSCS